MQSCVKPDEKEFRELAVTLVDRESRLGHVPILYVQIAFGATSGR